MLTAAITTLVAAMAAFAGLATAAPTAGNTLSTSGKFTYYSTGLGACGYTNTDADYVVALSRADFDPYTPNGNPNNNSLCGRKIRAYYNGKSVDVTIVDRCVACNSGDLDLSPTGFGVLADLNVGVIQGTWDWI